MTPGTLHDNVATEVVRLGHLAERRHPGVDPHAADVLAQIVKLAALPASKGRTARRYASYEELVIDRGRLHPWRPRPAALSKLEKRQCYRNALHLAMRCGYTYVEGYAMAAIPVAHAWVLDTDGYVIDATWDDATPTGFYLGIAMDTEAVATYCVGTGYHGVLCNDWLAGHRLLEHGAIDHLLAADHGPNAPSAGQ